MRRVILLLLACIVISILIAYERRPRTPVLQQPLSGYVSSGYSEPRPRHTGLASWYGLDYCKKFNPGCKQANGEVLTPNDSGIACDSRFRLGDKIVLFYEGRSVQAVCTDRGSFSKYGRTFDLHEWIFSGLASLSKGVIKVEYEEVE